MTAVDLIEQLWIVPHRKGGHWQAAAPRPGGDAGYTLLSCIVAPGFSFDRFELAAPGWVPGGGESGR